jgi:mannose-6-phosphate isomerase-like protein (cupin superfamily)
MPYFNKDMHQLAAKNSFFQKEVYLDKNVQIVLMSLAPGEDIGEETHRADQTTYFVSGVGQAVLDGKRYKVTANHMVVIPQGTRHNIVNKGTTPLKLFTVYAPPAEAPGISHRTKAEAEEAEKGPVEKMAEAVRGAAKKLKTAAAKATKKA